MKSYKLKTDGGKIGQALAQLCAEGEVGEALFRGGVNQASFCLFLAKLAYAHADAGRTTEQIADVFGLVSGGNTSAAQKALNDVAVHWEVTDKNGESVLDAKGNPTFEEKPQSVGAYWLSQGGGKTVANLSLLKL